MAEHACNHCNEHMDAGDIMDDECNPGKKICKWCSESCRCDLIHQVQ